MALKPKFDFSVLKNLLRVVVFNMPFTNKFVQVILGDREHGWAPTDKDIDDMAKAIETMKKDSKNFGNTTFLTTHDLVKFRPFSIEGLRKKIMFVVVGDEFNITNDVEFKKIELEIKSAFESAKLSTVRVVVLKYPVQLVAAEMSEDEKDEQTRKPGVDTAAPK